MRVFAFLLLLACLAQPSRAWWEPGHRIISVLAYDLLSSDEQLRLQTLLTRHPRLAQDFKLPADAGDQAEVERWMIGRAGYWPDVARSQPEYSRPNWHFQLGPTLVIGEPREVPRNPGPAPAGASLQSEELHIAQAVEICRRVLRDKSAPDADRALAVCWLLHLVGDAHQPCHAGSLYVAGVFPEGDRGANSIPTKQGRNLHALWDGLLGSRYDAGDVRRRCAVIRSDVRHWSAAEQAARKRDGLNPLTWLAESVQYGRTHVYTPEVLEPVNAVARGLTMQVEMIDLPSDYLKSAGELARLRAADAAHRLALILSQDLR